MLKLHELRQQRNALATQMRDLHTDIGDESWSNEQRTKWDEMKCSLDKLDGQISREQELRDLDQSFVEENTDDHEEQRNGGQEQTAEKRQTQAFEQYLRHGQAEMDAELRSVLKEMRAQGVGTDAKGGFTVPVEFQNRVIESMKAYGGVANIANVINTSHGRDMEWATSDGTSEEGELVGENTEASRGDVEYGAASIGAKKLSSKIILASNELLQDSGINVEAHLTGRMAQRIGRGESKYLVKGTGAGTPLQPKGLEVSVTGKHTAATTTKVTWKELNSLKHAVDPAYRMNSHFLFNDSTLKALTEEVDSQNRPIWLPAVAGVVPATILGERYQLDQAVDSAAAGKAVAFYGDFQKFIVRRVAAMAVRRLVERYAEFDQTGFLAFHRFDCLLEDTAAIKKLVMKAS
ncbi:phage major capsid protein [Endozoicomonas sp. ISHI1]|uniref:phage major capsid protein n=1 Tax=Endozoicomonas sp. ISHI1 TaxID=2825882 RepID=UPI0021498FD2|nr:phage major capsid protein [Endozoicomonas sp. ISHI1]